MKEPHRMTTQRVGTREEWLAERVRAAGRREGAHTPQRRARPAAAAAAVGGGASRVRVRHRGREAARCAELFAGRSQLLVYHLMFGPSDAAACPGCSFTVGQPGRECRAPEPPRRDIRRRVARPARSVARLPAADGLELSLGLVARRLQHRLRRVHRRGAAHRRRVQLRLGPPRGHERPQRRAARPVGVRAHRRHRPSHLLVLRPRYRRPQWNLAAARPRSERPRSRLAGWPRRHDEYQAALAGART